jgi:dihydroorotase-like cyclic amidohydrolase
MDQTREEKVTADMTFSKCGWTLYEGMTMKGVPVMTFSRGVQVFKDGQLTAKPGHGKYQAMGCGYRSNGD